MLGTIESTRFSGTGDGLMLKAFVAANLSFYLEHRGISREDFASKVGVKLATVSRWLNAKRTPEDKYFPKILKTLNVRLSDLTHDPSMPRNKEAPPLPPLPPPTPPPIPRTDVEAVLRFMRLQANQLGYDLTKISDA